MTAGESSATAAADHPNGTKSSPKPVSVLFVCLGNICRSTMAEGIFRNLTFFETPKASTLISHIDSCGTGAYHVGDDPDSRTMSTLEDNGITTYRHAARKLAVPDDYLKFTYLFAMDRDNLQYLQRTRERLVAKGAYKEEQLGRVMLWGSPEFGGRGRKGEEVDDPYYGGRDGFEIAFEQCTRFGKGFLRFVEEGQGV